MPAKGEHVGMHGLSRRMFGTAVATTALVAMTGSIATADDDAGYVEMTLGNPDAQLVVTEYLMFTCPHCKNFHETVYPRLKQEYIDTGRILYRVREAYFNRPALWAAMIARCGGQDKYFGISDMLFARQDDWSRQESPAAIVERLAGIGMAAGLTMDQIQVCLSDATNAEMLFNTQLEHLAEDDIDSTPSFVIEGERYSNMSYDDFAEILDSHLAE